MTPTGRHPTEEPGPEPTEFELAQVSAALRRLPAEVAMPEHVSERITAALAAEAASEGAPGGQRGGTVAWFRRALPRTLAAAAVVGVIGFGGYLLGTMDDGTDTAAESSAAGGAEMSGEVLERDAQDDAAEAAPGPMAAADSAALEQAVLDVWSTSRLVAAGCGQALADDLDASLVGSTTTDGGVLIVVESGDGTDLTGYLVPTCTSLADAAVVAPVVVPAPAQ